MTLGTITLIKDQFITDEQMNFIDDRSVDYFADREALDEWTILRASMGRPVPDGKIIVLEDELHYYHYNNGMWIKKFERVSAGVDVEAPFVGTIPYRKGNSIGDTPTVATSERIGRGFAGAAFRTDSALASEGPVHNNHIPWTLTGTLPEANAIEVLTTFTCQLVLVGAGGNGGDWLTTPHIYADAPTRRYVGAAGAGAGGVTTKVVTFFRGDLIHWTCGTSGNSYTNGWTHIYRNGDILFSAPPGIPQTDGNDIATIQFFDVFGSARGAFARTDLSFSGLTGAFTDGNFFNNSTTGGRIAQGNILVRSSIGHNGRGTKAGAVLSVAAAGGGGGAGGSSTNVRDTTGGWPLSLDWWSTIQYIAAGGPGGSLTGRGNAHRLSRTGTVITGIPTFPGSGGAGGGDVSSQRAGTAGQPGIIYMRIPVGSAQLVVTDLS